MILMPFIYLKEDIFSRKENIKGQANLDDSDSSLLSETGNEQSQLLSSQSPINRWRTLELVSMLCTQKEHREIKDGEKGKKKAELEKAGVSKICIVLLPDHYSQENPPELLASSNWADLNYLGSELSILISHFEQKA